MRLIFAILLFSSAVCLSQTNPPVDPLEGYSDGWSGDISLFENVGPGNRLQLKAPPEAGEAYIFTSGRALEDAEWLVHFTMEFNPSSSNYLQIYLATDDTSDFNNGFYLVLGTSNDNISLWQRKNGVDSLLIAGAEDRLDQSSVSGKVRVTRSPGGVWHLESDTGDGWQTEGNSETPFGFSVSYFGLSCHYTSTRSDKFFIGPLLVSGKAFADTLAPVIEQLQVVNGRQITLSASEPLDTLTATPNTLTFSPAGIDVERIRYTQSSQKVELHLAEELPALEEASVTLSGWTDLNGNRLKDTTLYFSYTPPRIIEAVATGYSTVRLCFSVEVELEWLQPEHFRLGGFAGQIESITRAYDNCFELLLSQPLPDGKEVMLHIKDLLLPNGDKIPEGPYPLYYHEAARHDVVVNEVMADPVPPALLPAVEYLELFNRSLLPVNLGGMMLKVNDRSAALPSFLLYPGEYAVLFSDNDIALVGGFENQVPVSGWPGLPNSGAQMVLRNPSGAVVTAFEYAGPPPGEAFKQEGGWSLEVLDPDNLSNARGNRGYSSAPEGGTPGFVNSLFTANPDHHSPALADAWLENASTLALRFSEPMTGIKEGFELDGNNAQLTGVHQDEVWLSRFNLSFAAPLTPHEVHTLMLPEGLTDLAGNLLTEPLTLNFGLPGPIDSFDVVINELLYDPPDGGSDYVELYNRSNHIAGLSSLCLSRATPTGEPEKLNLLSDKLRWFLPDQRLCFSADTATLKLQYACELPQNLKLMPGLPNFTNEGGGVYLARLNGQVVDYFGYHPGLHYPLLTSTKGVALERTMPDAATHFPSTWHSAAATAGYGTPTGVNSQHIPDEEAASGELFTVSPEIFTPNQDGYEDVLVIGFAFEEPGHTGTIRIYNTLGEVTRHLINNRSLGTTGQITWDGTRDDGSRCPPGIYIVWGRMFNLDGRVHEYKTTCVLGTGDRMK